MASFITLITAVVVEVRLTNRRMSRGRVSFTRRAEEGLMVSVSVPGGSSSVMHSSSCTKTGG